MNEELLNKILNYLIKRPYGEVYTLINPILAELQKEKETKKTPKKEK